MLHRATKASSSIDNFLLLALPREEFKFIQPHLEPVSFPPGHVYAGYSDSLTHCYFPNNGMISLLTVTGDGHACEVGYIGREGMVGISIILGRNELPYQALVQAKTDGFRAPTEVVAKLFKRNGIFHDVSLRFMSLLFAQFAQTSACNRFHSIESRLCRWFAVMCERSGDRHLVLTQEFLAYMLGVQRTSIATSAHSMQKKKLIRYSRGKIEVIDLEKLKASACECLPVINGQYARFLREEKNLHMSATRQTPGKIKGKI
ncbi:MAG TPA: Crp/Fnr family transcriptional regulator [Pyrinomonadaceae bacterium]|nr:Crp/Fnr family transcriptional regulator [Pyrinomonadaceae bacterium]